MATRIQWLLQVNVMAVTLRVLEMAVKGTVTAIQIPLTAVFSTLSHFGSKNFTLIVCHFTK